MHWAVFFSFSMTSAQVVEKLLGVVEVLRSLSLSVVPQPAPWPSAWPPPACQRFRFEAAKTAVLSRRSDHLS